MSYMTAGNLQAFDLLMKQTPGTDHYDSGYEGVCPECRSCRFHRPLWRYQSCVFTECPYCAYPLSTIKTEKSSIAAGKENNHE